jgi:hypothetical protein
MAELEKFKKRLLLHYYTRPQFVFKQISNNITSPRVLMNYTRFGIKMLKNVFFK